MANDDALYCSIILWDLSRSGQTVASLRAYLRDSAVDAYAQVPGLRQKTWISSTGPEGETWGAVYLWDNAQALYGRPPAASQVGRLIGYMPTSRQYFGVEATVEGVSTVGALIPGLGLAFQGPDAPVHARPQEYIPQGAPVISFDSFRPAGPSR
ncbi:hypothetical protein [Actinoplanes sp. NPDC051494]|uniref:hypothetical protein n=1 Tax=Actinoplanes sp. NPDC051494 TaxID=3363907 RepID=UPI0037AA1A67